jgi:putative acetyltransferase
MQQESQVIRGFARHGGSLLARRVDRAARIGFMISIRAETDDDVLAIRGVNNTAFGTNADADLVDALRAAGLVLLSLVAEIDGRIVGHILFSRMWITSAGSRREAVALAPMAVVPSHQKQGVGGRLIREGLDRLRARGEQIVLVVGHPEYYPRFGFSSERAAALSSPFPPGVFMALELAPGALDDVAGSVTYPEAFGL